MSSLILEKLGGIEYAQLNIAHVDGMMAAGRGEVRAANPHAAGTDDWFVWEAGYILVAAARREDVAVPVHCNLCGAALVQVAGPNLQAVLCPGCDADSEALQP